MFFPFLLEAQVEAARKQALRNSKRVETGCAVVKLNGGEAMLFGGADALTVEDQPDSERRCWHALLGCKA
ncbi:hypothetical protein NKJ64_22185 [Mesorhizobium sp. M0062]|uniref:hypothetical protein n=1 Tax=Mesorhizobium sp. M0062 TaxID=2956867 RepID=UPI0033387F53